MCFMIVSSILVMMTSHNLIFCGFFSEIFHDKPQLFLLIKTLFSAKYGAKTHLY